MDAIAFHVALAHMRLSQQWAGALLARKVHGRARQEARHAKFARQDLIEMQKMCMGVRNVLLAISRRRKDVPNVLVASGVLGWMRLELLSAAPVHLVSQRTERHLIPAKIAFSILTSFS
jgi:hypothetical protein